MWTLLEDRVVLKAPVAAEWLARATGAPWQAEEEGLVLRAWDADGLEPAHTQRRLAARARQAAGALEARRGASGAGPGVVGAAVSDPGRVRIRPALIPSEDELPVMQQGFELQIRDELATMADLADAVNQFADAHPWTRTRPAAAVDVCEGCPHCCADPVPVSLLDLTQLAGAGGGPHMGAGGDLAGCMTPLADGYCAFLDRETRRCTVHARRPWICRTYFCCPEGPVAEAVREEIVGHILASTLDLGVDTPLRHAQDYRQVLLIDLLSEPVWKLAVDPETSVKR